MRVDVCLATAREMLEGGQDSRLMESGHHHRGETGDLLGVIAERPNPERWVQGTGGDVGNRGVVDVDAHRRQFAPHGHGNL